MEATDSNLPVSFKTTTFCAKDQADLANIGSAIEYCVSQIFAANFHTNAQYESHAWKWNAKSVAIATFFVLAQIMYEDVHVLRQNSC